MEKVEIKISPKYEIFIGHGLLGEAGKFICSIKKSEKICIITDTNVEKLYEQTVRKSLEKVGYRVSTFSFPSGENSKNMDTVEKILEYMAEGNFTRSDMIVALGGGIVGDISGFAAAVYLRGIDFIQIPTTFLAAVDSSVGGKTAVNLKAGKNLAGSFWQPKLVICDCDTFNTLKREDFLDGVAEAIKYGAICDRQLFQKLYEKSDELCDLRKENTGVLENIVKRCVEIKGDIVEQDEKDLNIRQLLNFGHTVGHAIEKCSNFEISHGKAVAQGMSIIAGASANMGIFPTEENEKIQDVLKKYGFSLNIKYTAKELAEFGLKDKKRMGDTISLVLIDKIGHCYLQKTPIVELEQIIELGIEK